ncbi:MAG TPA: pyruvate dehydrogenase complex dihydrolipoamide acetyltransferase [Chitinophagales bacterium]|nr:pyruvate dehydrogenase complex dihydrolipoamide acetyltransferase [Chitinophagales bacterium]HMU68362.1 pyruvate dehydrogenase complex dihydrolipoamide acetyltransferase [Chitinophagales bacterium]HMX05069.1 pyruvate dehydrogenase complex dihydrolipoamide acetyltransferase [Chitinophagales bacterium]HNE46682.1 pyruvate dehydrogenase complex dihydrolipoamide acetyltransferase [Chitinophagales bacterium]HNI53102.1 pyruvate dehydrogenase complex dihydrolipoamide acetyltransferase [Chitinophagal
MAEVIRMPRMSDTMTEGTFVEWHKKVGDTVKIGDILAEVETDKATMELENYAKGTLLYIGVEKGQSAKVDQVIAIVGKEGDDVQALLASAGTVAKAEEKAPSTETKQAEATIEVAATTQDQSASNTEDGRIKASPLAKKIAKEKGLDLHAISGSGPEGRIIKKDVEQANPIAVEQTESAKPQINFAPVAGVESYEEVPVSQMRKVIAQRLSQSKFTSPHFYLSISVDMDKAMAARTSMNAVSPVKISFNDLVVKASAMALRRHPQVNASWLGDKIRFNHHIHIGVAVAINDGLVVPVLRFADQKSLAQLSAETGDLAERAKSRKLQPQDWEGNTFTISNLGMMGIEEFTAIINPPDACILAVGGINQVPVVKNGQVVPGNVMKLTMSCDHRVVDGAVGAQFLKTLKEYLEDPVRMLI